MVKAKTKNKQDRTRIYIGVIIILAVAVVGLLGGLIFTATRTAARTYEEKEYLAVYEHLMSRYPEMKCVAEDDVNITAVQDEDGKYLGVVQDEDIPDTRTCTMTGYGVSKDGDPYVSYAQQTYDPKTHEKKGEEEHLTVYFQHYNGHYADALGYDD